MQITPADPTELNFELVQTAEVTQRAFNVLHTVNDAAQNHLVLVHIDKQQNDIDGDGTIDTLDGKFCLSLIDVNADPILVNNKPIKISQVHSVSVEKISDGTIDIIDWISEISAQLIPMVINKKSTLISWGSF
jgi:hypothetical protein